MDIRVLQSVYLTKVLRLIFPVKKGLSPLLVACKNGHEDSVQLLLSRGADVSNCENSGGSPLK